MIYSETREVSNEAIEHLNMNKDIHDMYMFRSEIQRILNQLSMEELKQIFTFELHDKAWANQILIGTASRADKFIAQYVIHKQVTRYTTTLNLKDEKSNSTTAE